MANYVDGFVLAVPKRNLQVYRRIAQKAGRIMADPRLARMMVGKAMPFDMKRMIYGGFKVLVTA